IFQLDSNIERFSCRIDVTLKGFAHVRCDSIKNWTSFHCDIHVWNIANLHGAIRFSETRLTEISPTLLPVDFERRHERDVFDLVGSETRVHQPRRVPVLYARILPLVLNTL